MSIRVKLIIAFLIIALVPLFFLSILTFAHFRHSLQRQFFLNLQDIAAFKADKIETYFREITADMMVAQNAYVIKKNLPVLSRPDVDPEGPEYQAAQKMVDDVLRGMAFVWGLTDIKLMGPDGRVVYASDAGTRASRFSGEMPGPQKEALEEGKKRIVFSDIFKDDEKGGVLAMLVAGPAFDHDGAFAGVIAFKVKMAPIYKLVQDVTGLGATGETLLGKRIGDEALFLNPLRHDPGAALKRSVRLGDRFGRGLQAAVKGTRGFGEFLDYRGRPVIGVWRYLPSLGWGVVAKIDKEEAFFEITELRKRVMTIFAIIAVLCVVAVVLISRSISRPIKKLVDDMEIVGKGDLDHRVAISGRDEISRLSRAFDKMVYDLRKVIASRDELDREMAERHKAEDALRRSESEKTLILESANEMIAYHDTAHRVQWANRAYVDFIGAPLEKIKGRKCFHIRGFDVPCVDCPVSRAARSGRPESGEVTPENQPHWPLGQGSLMVKAAPVKDKTGSVIGVIEVAYDITEQKRVEKELRDSEENLKRAESIARLGSWELDLDRNQLRWSDEAYRIFGLLPQEFPATYEAFLERVHPDDRAAVDAAYTGSVRENRDGYELEHRVVRKDTGEVRVVHEKCEHFRDAAGRVVRSVGMVHDITERKGAEEVLKRDKETLDGLVLEKTRELVETRIELERARRLSDIGQLASTVAHELRNPLATIGLAALNIKKKAKNADIERHLANIETKIAESDQIINNLLYYARIKPPRFESVDMSALVEECVAVTHAKCARKVSVKKKIAPIKDILIEADRLQVSEVLANILNNAFDAVGEKGGKVEVLCAPEKDGVEVRVRDNGEGIDPDDLARIFDPFFSTKAKGTGLGLTVCRQIIDHHKGWIHIESELGKGTTAVVWLPKAHVK